MSATPQPDIAAIRERWAAAAPGPWQECGHDRGGCECGFIWARPHDVPVARAIDRTMPNEMGEGYTPEQRALNAVAIAHAPTDIAALLAEIERLRARVEGAA